MKTPNRLKKAAKRGDKKARNTIARNAKRQEGN